MLQWYVNATRAYLRPMRTITCAFSLCAAACGIDPAGSSSGIGDGSVAAGDSADVGQDVGHDAVVQDAITAAAPVGPYFTTPMFFNTDVSLVSKAANSASII